MMFSIKRTGKDLKRQRIFCSRALVCVGMVIVLCTSLVGASFHKEETVHATVWQKTIRVDGVPIGCYDFQDNYVRTFAIEGTVYIPLRTACELLGADAEWIPEENVLKLTTTGEPYLRDATLDQIDKERTEEEQKAWSDQVRHDYQYGMDVTRCRNVTVSLNGKECPMTNAVGTEVYPAWLRGEFYLPIRSVGELCGKEVCWQAGITRDTSVGTYTADFAVLYQPFELTWRHEVIHIYDKPVESELSSAQAYLNKLQNLYDSAFAAAAEFRNDPTASEAEAREKLAEVISYGNEIQKMKEAEQAFLAQVSARVGQCGKEIRMYAEEVIHALDSGMTLKEILKIDAFGKNISDPLNGLRHCLRDGQDFLEGITIKQK